MGVLSRRGVAITDRCSSLAPARIGQGVPVILAEPQVDVAVKPGRSSIGSSSRRAVGVLAARRAPTAPARRRGVDGKANGLSEADQSILGALHHRAHERVDRPAAAAAVRERGLRCWVLDLPAASLHRAVQQPRLGVSHVDDDGAPRGFSTVWQLHWAAAVNLAQGER